MGLSRNKVAVPEGAAGSPPFYGDYYFFVWNTQCFWVDAHPHQLVVGLQQTVRHEKEEFGVSHCLKKGCVGALLGVWNSTGLLWRVVSVLHVGLLAVIVVGDCVWGVLFENCIVDASIFIF